MDDDLRPQGGRTGLSNGIRSVFLPVKTKPRMLTLYHWINVCKICWNHPMERGIIDVSIDNVSVVPLCSSFPMFTAVGTSSKEEKFIFIIWVLVCWGGDKRQTYQWLQGFSLSLQREILSVQTQLIKLRILSTTGHQHVRDSTWPMCSAMSSLVTLPVQKRVFLPLK